MGGIRPRQLWKLWGGGTQAIKNIVTYWYQRLANSKPFFGFGEAESTFLKILSRSQGFNFRLVRAARSWNLLS